MYKIYFLFIHLKISNEYYLNFSQLSNIFMDVAICKHYLIKWLTNNKLYIPN